MTPSPKPPIKLLAMGHCHGVFVAPMVVHFAKFGTFETSVFEIMSPGAELRGADPAIYKKVLTLPPLEPVMNRWRALGAVARGKTWRGRLGLIKDALRYLTGRAGSTSFLDAMAGEHAAKKQTAQVREMLKGYDIYHLNFLDPYLTSYVRLLPPGAKCVASIWGSDLLRADGVAAYAKQLELYERADLITTNSLEMAEIFLAKFGRQFLPKLRFACSAMHFESLDQENTPAGKSRFRDQHRIAPGQIVVCVGNSAAERNQHLAVLDALARLPEPQRRRLTVVLPMTYGKVGDYPQRVKDRVQQLQLDARILETFLPDAEVSQLRWASDVYIQVPDTDAFSVTMREALYAENIVIAGAWLPYAELRRHGIYYREVAALAEVGPAVRDVIDDLPREKARLAGVRDKMRAHYGMDTIVQTWLTIYNELLTLEPSKI